MAHKVPHGVALGGTYGNTYIPAVTGSGNSPVEAYVQFRVTRAGTFSGLSVYSDTANAIGITTLTFRKNGVDTGITVTYLLGESGLKQDNVNSVSVVVGDLVSVGVSSTTGSLGIASSCLLFGATSDDTIQFLLASGFVDYTFNSLTRFFAPTGDIYINNNIESYSENRIQNAVTVSDLAIYISTNGRSTASTLNFRKNNADQNQVVSIGAGVTGLIRDTTNSDTLAVNDFFCTKMLTGGSGGTLHIRHTQMTLVSTDPTKFTMLASSTWNRSMTTSPIYGHAFGGLGSASNPETSHGIVLNADVKISRLGVQIGTNSGNADIIFENRKNGVSGNLGLTVPLGTTGWYSDLVNEDTVGKTDRINFATFCAGGTGTMSLRSRAVLATFPSTLRIIMS